MKIRIVSYILMITFSMLSVACSTGQSYSSSDITKPTSSQTIIIHTTTGTGELDADQAIAIAKLRFDEYLLGQPEMKVTDPVYLAKKKVLKDLTEYWSVTVKLKEPEYKFYYYEVQISLDGEKVTLATG